MTPRDKTLELSSVRITLKTDIYQMTYELWALILPLIPNIWNFSSQEIFCCE